MEPLELSAAIGATTKKGSVSIVGQLGGDHAVVTRNFKFSRPTKVRVCCHDDCVAFCDNPADAAPIQLPPTNYLPRNLQRIIRSDRALEQSERALAVGSRATREAAGSGIKNVRILKIEGEHADSERRELIGERCPGWDSIGGVPCPPHTAAHCAHIYDVGISRVCSHGLDGASSGLVLTHGKRLELPRKICDRSG